MLTAGFLLALKLRVVATLCTFSLPFLKMFLFVSAVSNQWYYLVLRIVNMAGDDIEIKPSDGDPAGVIIVRKNVIAVITKKTKSPLPCSFTAFLKTNNETKFYINYKPSITLKPITTKNPNSAITLTVTKNGK